MNYKENHGYYYEIILDDSLFNKTKIPSGPKSNNHNDLQNYLNIIYQLKHEEEKSNGFYTHLHSFINEKFNYGGIKLPATNNKAFIISRNEQNIEACKEFCHYLVGNIPVLTLLIKHREDKTALLAGLETVYKTLQLEKELKINNGSSTKRAKL